jgi:hypothetical protein
MTDKITVDDVRLAGYCAVGAKKWFRLHALDFRSFLKGGIAVEEFLATEDAIARDIVEKRNRRRLGGQKE